MTTLLARIQTLALASLSASNSKLILKGGVSGFSLQNSTGSTTLLNIDSAGNNTCIANVYVPNLVQQSELSSHVTNTSLFQSLSDYMYKDTEGTETTLQIDPKFRMVVGDGACKLNQLFDIGPTPSDTYVTIFSAKLDESGQGQLLLNDLAISTDMDQSVSITMSNKQNGYDNIYKWVLEDYASGTALLALCYQLPGIGQTLQKALDLFDGNM
ncbi:unnamed protein product [Polarella glacialis]|uniref:Uncharacterized protein n=1 Tax=Polarella glacialis TaxID=89957 RepID=A0A813JYY4_POLGL|nr:unnamed protein product [Polarella glacialis]